MRHVQELDKDRLDFKGKPASEIVRAKPLRPLVSMYICDHCLMLSSDAKGYAVENECKDFIDKVASLEKVQDSEFSKSKTSV